MGSGEAEIVPEQMNQQLARFDLKRSGACR